MPSRGLGEWTGPGDLTVAISTCVSHRPSKEQKSCLGKRSPVCKPGSATPQATMASHHMVLESCFLQQGGWAVCEVRGTPSEHHVAHISPLEAFSRQPPHACGSPLCHIHTGSSACYLPFISVCPAGARVPCWHGASLEEVPSTCGTEQMEKPVGSHQLPAMWGPLLRRGRLW